MTADLPVDAGVDPGYRLLARGLKQSAGTAALCGKHRLLSDDQAGRLARKKGHSYWSMSE